MKTAEWADNAAANPAAGAEANPTASADDARRVLLSALAGKAGSPRARRGPDDPPRGVDFAGSDAGPKRRADGAAVLWPWRLCCWSLLALGPFVWHLTDGLLGGEHMADIFTQTSLWICILCPVILAAVIVAGWAHIRQ